MKNFTQWLDEKKTREPMPTTSVSSPLRGYNQDYSGVNTKNSNADYTISDETVAATNPATRTTPVNMKKTGSAGTSNSPSNSQSMQSSADARRIQLDKLGQQQQELQKKKQEQDQKTREKQQQINQKKSEAQKQQKPANEEVITEGRPKNNATEDDPGSEHVMMQMRKVISTRGLHKVKHVSGEKSDVHPQTAHKILHHHDNLKTTGEKQSYAARIHKSKSSMSDALSGKPEHVQPKVSLAGKLSGTQK